MRDHRKNVERLWKLIDEAGEVDGADERTRHLRRAKNLAVTMGIAIDRDRLLLQEEIARRKTRDKEEADGTAMG